MGNWKETYRRFRTWQQQPHQVKPLSEASHVCTTCDTRFEGNYCPRCGQSARIGRYSFKKAFLLFLDVWGLGNRGMFRTLRDLMLRPGYMIRDYLQGMQMAYFPPFKMFFLLVALTLLVENGVNIRGVNRMEQRLEIVDLIDNYVQNDPNVSKELGLDSKGITRWAYKHMTLVSLVFLLFFSVPLYLFFRHCPNIPDMRFSEFFVATVYISNMLTIYNIIAGILCLPLMIEPFLFILALIPLKQLSGYPYWRTILKVFFAFLIFLVIYFLTSIIITTAYLLFVRS